MPIRTCISCRKKHEQKKLKRFQCIDKELLLFTKIGRSFYICEECLLNTKQLEKALFRQCKNKDNYMLKLKEILTNGR
jgi:predicted RNA-binding protein YlxR (DUF448 family)